VLTACADVDRMPGVGPDPSDDDGGMGGAGGGDDVGAGGEFAEDCSDGEVMPCKFNLPTQNGVTSCFIGERQCLDGEWGPCDEPAPEGVD
jgi:hypothetical protein